jgi:hypothetical protein
MMVKVINQIEERLSQSALTALNMLVGSALTMRMPWINVHADGSFFADKIMFMRRRTNSAFDCIELTLTEFESEVLDDHYYRYAIAVRENTASKKSNLLTEQWWMQPESCSSWSYDENANAASIRKIEVYSYISVPDQLAMWPELEELSEAHCFDYEILLVMSDNGRVSIKPMHTVNLLSLTLKPSFEIPQYRRQLGRNLSLRLTIN